MGRFLLAGSSAAAAALSFLMMIVFSNECSANAIPQNADIGPPSENTLEIAGMGAFYEQDGSYQELGLIMNEYSNDENSSDGSKNLVRQIFCKYRKNRTDGWNNCVLREEDEIETGQVTLESVQQAFGYSRLRISRPIIYDYQMVNKEHLLDFNLKLKQRSMVECYQTYISKPGTTWSQPIQVERDEWKCEERDLFEFECFWKPENASKRIVKGIN